MPDFDVTTSDTTFKAGQQITFSFTGTAQNIAFWSGERGHIYANRSRTVEQGVLQTLTFTTAAGAGTQNSDLSVLVSKDFDGIYAAADISKATWTDITARATLSPNAASGAAGASTSSGAVNITDQSTPDNIPVYVAFRYFSPLNTLVPRQWTISSLSVSNTLADGTVNNVVPNMQSSGLQSVDIQNSNYSWSLSPNAMTPTSATLKPGPAGTQTNEDWLITAPIKLNNVSLSDYGVSVTSLGTLSPPKTYAYTFNTPGRYTITFYAFNENIKDTKGIIKQLTLNITP